MKTQPPKWALRFLRWYCREEFLDELEGDLLELFSIRSSSSIRSARLFFVWNVLRSFRWINIKKSSKLSIQFGMYGNYLKVGFRAIKKDWKFSLLNVLGLSIGMAIFVAMLIFVDHETSFDRFHSNGDRIFQVIQNFTNPDGDDPEIWTSFNLSEVLREEMPMIENAVSIHGATDTWVDVGGSRFFEDGGIVAGPEFLDMFDFKLVHGDRKTALATESHSIVISEGLSRKYFGTSSDVVGKSVVLEKYGTFVITGVMTELPTNSFIQFDYVITQNYEVFFEQAAPWVRENFKSWGNNPTGTFVLLKIPSSEKEFSHEVHSILTKYIADTEDVYPHYLINLYDLHFGLVGVDGSLNEFIKGDKVQVRIIYGIAIGILLMACFNYINLTTSRSLGRSKEVGVRKSIGATKWQLQVQFLTESFIMVVVSFVISWILVLLLFPLVQDTTGVQMTISGRSILGLIPSLLVTVLVVTLLAGFYPAIYLGRFGASSILRNTAMSRKGNAKLRRVLVFVQFSFVYAVLTSLVIISMQNAFLKSKSPGFKTNDLLIVEVDQPGLRDRFEELKFELLQSTQIEKVSGITRMISGYRSGLGIYSRRMDEPAEKVGMRYYGMDHDGFSTLGLSLVEGSPFLGIRGIDSTTVFLNEQAAKFFGGHKIIGQMLVIEDEDGKESVQARVGGILKDFHYRSLHDPIGPILIGSLTNPLQGLGDIAIQVKPENFEETIAFVERTYRRYDDGVMIWEFMNDMVQRAYEREATLRRVLTAASVTLLAIAILGLIGMIAFNISSKTKEIGIRKVFGASIMEITTLLAKTSTSLLTLVVLVVTPIVYWIGHQWLENFAFRVRLNIWPFVTIVLLLLILTVGLVVILTYGVTRKNPVESLRHE